MALRNAGVRLIPKHPEEGWRRVFGPCGHGTHAIEDLIPYLVAGVHRPRQVPEYPVQQIVCLLPYLRCEFLKLGVRVGGLRAEGDVGLLAWDVNVAEFGAIEGGVEGCFGGGRQGEELACGTVEAGVEVKEV